MCVENCSLPEVHLRRIWTHANANGTIHEGVSTKMSAFVDTDVDRTLQLGAAVDSDVVILPVGIPGDLNQEARW